MAALTPSRRSLGRLRRLSLGFTVALTAALAVPGIGQGAIVGWGGPGTGPGQFSNAPGIATNSAGQVYVTDADEGGTSLSRVQKFSATGGFLTEWGTWGSSGGQFMRPRQVATSINDDVFVVDSGGHRVEKFTSDGTFMLSFGSYGTGDGQLRFPGGIAVSPDGNTIYVSDGDGRRIEAFSSTGTFLRKWGADGTADGQFKWGGPEPNLGVDPAGDVYVADSYNQRVQVFDSTGNFLRKWHVDGHPSGIAVDRSGEVYVVASGRVQRFSALGQLRGAYTPPTPPVAVTTDSERNVLTAGGAHVWKIDPTAPQASLSLTPALAHTGQSVSLDASASSVPFYAPTDFEWDLDANGTYETDTGTTSTATTTFTTRGRRTIAVRVTAPGGKQATATANLEVRQAPPAGPIGLSVNHGAQFTNDPQVSLTPVWPAFGRAITASNDGGFAGAQTLAVEPALPWTLQSSGPERLPRTVYARFDDSTQTFQDDIILDQTPPVVTLARVTAGATAASESQTLLAAASTVELVADDSTSGVAIAQFAVDRAAPSAPIAYAVKLRVAGAPRIARVQDHAGNWSSWLPVALPVIRPKLTVSSPRLRRLSRGVKLKVACAQACTVRAKARIASRSARQLRLHGITLATTRGRRKSAGTLALRLRPQKRVARRAAQRARLKVTVSASVTMAGVTSTVSKRVTLR